MGASCSLPYTPRRKSRGVKPQKWLNGRKKYLDGTWRSPVAHLNGVQGVAGSNPAVPIGEWPRGSEAVSGSFAL